MRVESTSIPGVFHIRLQPITDARGMFARIWCEAELGAYVPAARIVQCSLSWNRLRGTLRGLHLQAPPSREGKLVRCIRGELWDVALDLRPHSPTFLEHVAFRLDSERRDALFVPPGVAHGFQTLVDDTELLYMMTDIHAPELSRTYRWDDPAWNIEWPVSSPIMSDKDRQAPVFDVAVHRRDFGGSFGAGAP